MFGKVSNTKPQSTNLKDIFKKLNWKIKGICINEKQLNNLKKYGLKMNLRKTKMMFKEDHQVNIERLHEYKYLGQNITLSRKTNWKKLKEEQHSHG